METDHIWSMSEFVVEEVDGVRINNYGNGNMEKFPKDGREIWKAGNLVQKFPPQLKPKDRFILPYQTREANSDT